MLRAERPVAPPFTGTVTIDAVDVATGRVRPAPDETDRLAPGPAVVERFSAPLGAVDATRTLCLIKCVDDAGASFRLPS